MREKIGSTRVGDTANEAGTGLLHFISICVCQIDGKLKRKVHHTPSEINIKIIRNYESFRKINRNGTKNVHNGYRGSLLDLPSSKSAETIPLRLTPLSLHQ